MGIIILLLSTLFFINILLINIREYARINQELYSINLILN